MNSENSTADRSTRLISRITADSSIQNTFPYTSVFLVDTCSPSWRISPGRDSPRARRTISEQRSFQVSATKQLIGFTNVPLNLLEFYELTEWGRKLNSGREDIEERFSTLITIVPFSHLSGRSVRTFFDKIAVSIGVELKLGEELEGNTRSFRILRKNYPEKYRVSIKCLYNFKNLLQRQMKRQTSGNYYKIKRMYLSFFCLVSIFDFLPCSIPSSMFAMASVILCFRLEMSIHFFK